MTRILLIDDDDAMRTLVAARLSNTYDVVATADPTEALSLALELRPECILLDLLMPDLTGFELCKTFSSLSLTRKTPILVFSGNPAIDYQEFCSHLGARDYFQKPLDFHRLRARIAELVAKGLQEPRGEPSVKLKVGIELRGLDQHGNAFRAATSTEDVSVNGFRCACETSLLLRSQVEVYLRSGDAKKRLGRAQVVHALQRVADLPEYGFHFMQRPAEWLL